MSRMYGELAITLELIKAAQATREDDRLRREKPANAYLLPTAKFTALYKNKLEMQRILRSFY